MILVKNNYSSRSFLLSLLYVTTLLIGTQHMYYKYTSLRVFAETENEDMKSNVNQIYMENAPKESAQLPCGKFPSLDSLYYDNKHWQRLNTTDGTFYLYAAYYDNRSDAVATPLTPGGLLNLTDEYVSKEKTVGPSVRLIGMNDKIDLSVKTYCQLWFNYELVVEPVLEYKYIWFNVEAGQSQSPLQPYLITCRISKKYGNRVPSAVSLVERECDHASNMLRVIYNGPEENKKKGLAVCVKGLSFPDDVSIKLAEWFDLLNILGAEKVFVYDLHIHPNISKVLDYYEKNGIVDIKHLTLPGDQPNAPNEQTEYLRSHLMAKRLNELIPYNDCLYRNMHRYEFISLLDIDEVIVPMKHNSWEEMFKQVLTTASKDTTSLAFRNVYFLHEMLEKNKPDLHQDIPSFLYMLQHVYRSRNHTTGEIKSFHNTEKVKTLHNHNALSCLKSACVRTIVDTALAQMHHYRKNCPNGEICDSLYRKYVVEDTTIWRWKDQLISRTLTALTEMGLLEK